MKRHLLWLLLAAVPLSAKDLPIAAIDTTVGRLSALEPWRKRTEPMHVPAIPFRGRYVIALLSDGEPKAAVIRSSRSSERTTARLVRRDSELRLAVFRAADPADSSDQANPLLPDRISSEDLPPLALNLQSIPLKTALRTAGVYGESGHTVFYEGTGYARSPAGNAMIPVIRFSGFQKDILAGHVLVQDGAVLGIVSGFDAATNTGYAIPAALISQFLTASGFDRPREGLKIEPNADRPEFDSPERDTTIVRTAGFSGRTLREPAYLKYSGLLTDQPVYIVTQTLYMPTEERTLLQGDLILSAAGVDISARGTGLDSYYGELPLPLALVLKNGRFVDDTSAALSVFRDREKRQVSIHISPASEVQQVVPDRFRDPGYLIVGGFVLLELSGDSVSAMEGGAPRLDFLRQRYLQGDNLAGERVVFVDKVLPLKANTGYDFRRAILTSVNGIGVHNLKHAHGIIKEARRKGEDVILAFEGNEIAVFSAAALAQSDEQIRKSYSIPFLNGNSTE